MDQRSEEWFAARLGRVTASRVHDIVAKTRSGAATAGRKNYKAELIVERLTGEREAGFTSAAMQWGTDTEPQARAAYEFLHGMTVEPCGFIPHPKIAMSGASPDGLIGSDGLIEIKCPNTATHLDTLLAKKIAPKYLSQIGWQLACTGRAWCDFVSFDPRLPPGMQLYVERVPADGAHLQALEVAVKDFLAELDEEIAVLVERYGAPEAIAA